MFVLINNEITIEIKAKKEQIVSRPKLRLFSEFCGECIKLSLGKCTASLWDKLSTNKSAVAEVVGRDDAPKELSFSCSSKIASTLRLSVISPILADNFIELMLHFTPKIAAVKDTKIN
ncbi:hypothetical protein [Microcoleus sp. PH2017_32_RDM_D_A]|uniref:hypothetical protein n=1 Tax=Microcoleus sp. PH2017_32_RDM_D_A TaxID=2798842 RepID=UPI0025E7D1DC|nr:hypothetical protein [Microcoleus sp. PH2017_32_RDM_D_A]